MSLFYRYTDKYKPKFVDNKFRQRVLNYGHFSRCVTTRMNPKLQSVVRTVNQRCKLAYVRRHELFFIFIVITIFYVYFI